MQKKYDSGRLQVVVDDGSKQGLAYSIGNLVESHTAQQVEFVANAVASLTDFPLSGAKSVMTYRYNAAPAV